MFPFYTHIQSCRQDKLAEVLEVPLLVEQSLAARSTDEVRGSGSGKGMQLP